MTAFWDFLTMFPSTTFYLDLLFTSSVLSLSLSVFIPRPVASPQRYVLEGRFGWSALRIHMGETVSTLSGLMKTPLHSSAIGMDKTPPSFICYSQIGFPANTCFSLGFSSFLVHWISNWLIPLLSCIDSNIMVLWLLVICPHLLIFCGDNLSSCFVVSVIHGF